VLPQYPVVLFVKLWSRALTVARDLDEVSPDFYHSFVSIVPRFDWQEDLLRMWKQSRITTLQYQGGHWFLTSMSDNTRYLFQKHGIFFEKVVFAIDPD
jgi:predicted esterase